MYNYSTCCTNRVLTRSVHQPRVYALGAPTTRLRVWCTPGALTNQGGGASVYRPRSLLHTIDSHHRLNEHTILYVFRAPRHDSLIPLNWYQQKASAYYTMPNQSLPSREAETTIQNIIQDLSSGVEPSIRKASSAHRAPRSTVGHRLTSRLLRHEAYPGLLHPL